MLRPWLIAARRSFNPTQDANLTGAKLVNVVLTGAIWEGANLTEVDFTDALIGSQDAKAICANPTLKGESRAEVGCRN